MLGGLAAAQAWFARSAGQWRRDASSSCSSWLAAGRPSTCWSRALMRSDELAQVRRYFAPSPRGEGRMTRFRPATPDDEAAWQALLGRERRRRLPARLGMGGGGRVRRPAAAPLRPGGGWRDRGAGRRPGASAAPWPGASGTSRTDRCSTTPIPQRAERLRAVTIGLREVGRAARVVAAKLEPRIEADSTAAALFGRLRPDPRPVQVGQTRLVELTDDDSLMASFDKDTRYAVRRSQREGVEVRVLTDASDTAPIDALHGLVLETQRRAGFPRPPLERYRIVWQGLGRRRSRLDPGGSPRRGAAGLRDARGRGRSLLLPVLRLTTRGAR